MRLVSMVPEAAADDLGERRSSPASRVVMRAEGPVDERHDRVEVGPGDGTEHRGSVPTSAPAVAAAFSSSCSPTSPGDNRVAMIPDPITATTSSPVPSASATSRRAVEPQLPVPVSISGASSLTAR